MNGREVKRIHGCDGEIWRKESACKTLSVHEGIILK
jgi:hypothetical protein